MSTNQPRNILSLPQQYYYLYYIDIKTVCLVYVEEPIFKEVSETNLFIKILLWFFSLQMNVTLIIILMRNIVVCLVARKAHYCGIWTMYNKISPMVNDFYNSVLSLGSHMTYETCTIMSVNTHITSVSSICYEHLLGLTGSVLDHRSLPPEFESQSGDI